MSNEHEKNLGYKPSDYLVGGKVEKEALAGDPEVPTYLRAILQGQDPVTAENARTLLDTFEGNMDRYGIVPGDVKLALVRISAGQKEDLSPEEREKVLTFVTKAFEK
jgi:hypothetical protein